MASKIYDYTIPHRENSEGRGGDIMKTQNITLLDGFWDRLDEEISKSGLNKKQLSQMCGIDRKTLYNPKRSNRYIRIVYLARICSVLKVSADYLLFGERK